MCWLCEQKRTTLKLPGQIDEQTTISDIRVTYTYKVEPSYQYVSNTIAPWVPYCWMCYLRNGDMRCEKNKEESRE